MLAQKLVTLASTLLLLQLQLEWPLHLSQIINIHLWFRTNKINKVYPLLALVNIVRENNSTDVMNMTDNLPDVEECDSEQEEYSMDCESDSDSSDSTCEISDYPCPFCHTNFINQEEVIEHMENLFRNRPRT